MRKEPEFKQDLPPASLVRAFDRMCGELPEVSIDALRAAVAAAHKRLEQAQGELLGPNLELAGQIAARLNMLIDEYPQIPCDKRRLVVGAVHYFNLEQDSIPDLKPLTGLDDDIWIVNYVLFKLGLPERCIKLHD